MKQITLSEGEFKSLLDGVKHSAAIDDCRPMLQYIRIEVEKNKITAYTLDGYRASRFIINRKTENHDEFVCYIKPVPFKETKSGTRQVLITHDDRRRPIPRKFSTRPRVFARRENIPKTDSPAGSKRLAAVV